MLSETAAEEYQTNKKIYDRQRRRSGQWLETFSVESLLKTREELDARILDVFLERLRVNPKKEIKYMISLIDLLKNSICGELLKFSDEEIDGLLLDLKLYKQLYSGWGKDALKKEREILEERLKLLETVEENGGEQE